MKHQYRSYSEEEEDTVRALFLQNRTDAFIAQRVNELPGNVLSGQRRSPESIRVFRCSLSLTRTYIEHDGGDPEMFSAADKSFQRAMRQAISAKKENPSIGIFHDHRPFVGRVIRPEPQFSGCSSAASLCAEAGDPQGAFEPA